jgi:hypothetical protein
MGMNLPGKVPNPEVSDTTGDAMSTVAGTIISPNG